MGSAAQINHPVPADVVLHEEDAYGFWPFPQCCWSSSSVWITVSHADSAAGGVGVLVAPCMDGEVVLRNYKSPMAGCMLSLSKGAGRPARPGVMAEWAADDRSRQPDGTGERALPG